MSARVRASGKQYVLAVAGATGNLGAPLTSTIVREYQGTVFKSVRALVRSPSSSSAQALVAQGAELHQINEANLVESFSHALEGVDVLVDILPAGTPHSYKDAMVAATIKNGVKVFFPCEWGLDRRREYWLWQYPPSPEKDAFQEVVRARARAAGLPLKTISVTLGFFLEMVFSPIVGFDHANDTYTCWGPPSQRITFTAEPDVGRAVAELACLALDPATAPRVPDVVRIAGDTVSIEEAARIVERVRGDGSVIRVVSEDGARCRARCEEALRAGRVPDVVTALRLCMADGRVDHSADNQNELVNPGQGVFEWATVERHAREKGL